MSYIIDEIIYSVDLTLIWDSGIVVRILWTTLNQDGGVGFSQQWNPYFYLPLYL